MVIIGLVLLVAAVVVGADVLWKNTGSVPEPEMFGDSLNISTASGLIGLGMAIGAAAVLGLVLLLAGLSRKTTRARSRRHELKDTTAQNERLARENEALRRSDRADDMPARSGEPETRGVDRY